jgi:hypothetical protein
MTPRARVIGGFVALIALAGLTVASIWAVNPPSPAPATAPADEFSAGRAYQHVERVGTRVHVAGSPPAADVASYLETTLESLGLQTEIQDGVGAEDALGGFAMAHVRNVVALLPGSDPTGRVILMAHYDSVQVSFGGNDDGAGVATLLETARAMSEGAQPRNDIVFLFTDAEEACLCGAEAFVSQHRYANRGGVVLNFEARGSGGPAIMFETSRGNEGVVGVYGAHAEYPVGTSFAVEVYRILPNDTDFTPFLESDQFTGLNTAYIDGSGVYHTPQDRPSTMDHGSLQQHGANALALARAFGAEDLSTLAKPSANDSTYFPVLGYLVLYPGSLVWPFAVLALVAAGGVAYLARRRGQLRWGRLAAGFGLALLPLLLAAVLAQLLWTLLVAIRPGYREMLDPWQPNWFRAGVVALVATVVLAWYGLLRKRFGAGALTVGGLLWLAVLGLVLATVTPGGSYLAALPALAVTIGLTVALLASRPWLRLLAVTLGAAVAVVILAPTVLLFFPALGLQTGGAAAFFAAMLGLALLPVLEYVYPPQASVSFTPSGSGYSSTVDAAGVPGPARARRWGAVPACVAGVLTVSFVGLGLATDRFDATHPAPTQLMYALDTDTGQARWVSAESTPSDWTSQYVTGTENLEGSFPVLGEDDLATGPAQAAKLPAPVLTVVSDVTTGDRRELVLSIRPERTVRLVYLRVNSEATVIAANADGRAIPIDPAATDPFSLLFHAPPTEGLTVRLTVQGAGPVSVRVMDGSDGLDSLPGFQPRPPGIGIEGSHDSELVLVAKTYPI